jgi:hypothetical protein
MQDPATLLVPTQAPALAQTTISAGATSNGAEIDLSKADYVVLTLILGTMNDALTVALQSSATSGSGYAAASPAISFAIPDGNDNRQYLLVVNVKESTQLARYGRFTFTAGAGGTVAVAAAQAGFSPGDSLNAISAAGVFAAGNVQRYAGNPG